MTEFEETVLVSLGRIEGKLDEHTVQDRDRFEQLETGLNLLMSDLAVRKSVAADAGHAAGATAGKIWGAIGAILGGILGGVAGGATR